MASNIVTNNGKKGGWLVGKRHYSKDGKPLGGIKAVVTDSGKMVELEGGEVIINREASKKHWKELSRINQSAGNGIAIEPPHKSNSDEDPQEYKDGGVIEFNPNKVPKKSILKYALSIKKNHPEIWKLGGNIFGNEAFENLKRVSDRGHWLDSEEWMYIKWRSYVARHAHDFRIEGVVAMLKWIDNVDRGFEYMKGVIEAEINKKSTRKMSKGGGVGSAGVLIAPNGAKSNLNAKQYKLVRTPEFKVWFGDWENSPETSSKVVDENGEPLVVYHGTKRIFTQFKEGKYLGSPADALNFFTTNNDTAIQDYDGWIVYPCFMKIVYPLKQLTRSPEGSIMDENKKGLKTDGFIFSSYEVVQKPNMDEETWLGVSKANQVKLAEKPLVRIKNKRFIEKYNKTFFGTNTTFDGNNPDMRYNKGGNLKNKTTNGDCYEIAGNIAMGNISLEDKGIKYIGKPYVIHAQVKGQGEIKGLLYGHAFIEDDVFVYDFSNKREIVIPKQIYYKIGEIKQVKPIYYKYTFEEANNKMLETGHYGSWELKTESGL